MGLLNELEFVRDEIAASPRLKRKKPERIIRSFGARIGKAAALAFKEKELLLFGLLQWASIGAGYFLWIQVLRWIPATTWQRIEQTGGILSVDLLLIAWSIFCVGIVSFPVGIFSGCMGAAHFLHVQGRESTIATCMKLVLPQSWTLWSFHWIDGWITVQQVFERIPRKNALPPAIRALNEASYYAWKLGISGVLPSNRQQSGAIRH